MRSTAIGAVILIAAGGIVIDGAAHAQQQQFALKSGESIDVGTVYWVVNCRSILVGLPEIEVLQGPPGVTLTIREEPVLPRRQGCSTKVPGGTVVMTTKDVAAASEGKLTYRVKYQTKDGPRQNSHTFDVSLFP